MRARRPAARRLAGQPGRQGKGGFAPDPEPYARFGLDIEEEVHDIAVLHHVFLAFHAQQKRALSFVPKHDRDRALLIGMKRMSGGCAG